MGPSFFQGSIWWEHTIRYPSTPQISTRQLSQHHLDSLNLCECHSSSEMPRRQFNVLWTSYCVVLTTAMILTMTYLSLAPLLNNTSNTSDRSSNVFATVVLSLTQCFWCVKCRSFGTPRWQSQDSSASSKSSGYRSFSTTNISPPVSDLTNFYHCFIPECVKIVEPLIALLSWGHEQLSWDDTTTLAHPKQHALINVTPDASNMAVGAVLQQYIDGQ
jgi:hypothetical protein